MTPFVPFTFSGFPAYLLYLPGTPLMIAYKFLSLSCVVRWKPSFIFYTNPLAVSCFLFAGNISSFGEGYTNFLFCCPSPFFLILSPDVQ